MPFEGFPLPSVTLGEGEFSVKIELSIPLAHAIVKIITDKRAIQEEVVVVAAEEEEEEEGEDDGGDDGGTGGDHTSACD